jgi:hypothetical protein
MESKMCTVILSADNLKLSWEYDEKLSFSYFRKKRIQVKDIQSIIYGPFSHTFRAYRLQALL